MSAAISGLIVHKTDASLLLCYVDHHDDAYRWAERRKLETHPKTGAAQLVEIRETVQEIIVPTYVEVAEHVSAQTALVRSYRRRGTTQLRRAGRVAARRAPSRRRHPVELADHLPSEAAEALLELATGGKPRIAEAVSYGRRSFRAS